MGWAEEPPQARSHLEAVPPEIEMAPGRGDLAGVVAGSRREVALRTGEMATAKLQGHDHLGRLEAHLGDIDPGKVQKALECSGDPHGFGLLGSVGFATPNLEAPVRVTQIVARSLPTAASSPIERWVRISRHPTAPERPAVARHNPWLVASGHPHEYRKTLKSVHLSHINRDLARKPSTPVVVQSRVGAVAVVCECTLTPRRKDRVLRVSAETVQRAAPWLKPGSTVSIGL